MPRCLLSGEAGQGSHLSWWEGQGAGALEQVAGGGSPVSQVLSPHSGPVTAQPGAGGRQQRRCRGAGAYRGPWVLGQRARGALCLALGADPKIWGCGGLLVGPWIP